MSVQLHVLVMYVHVTYAVPTSRHLWCACTHAMHHTYLDCYMQGSCPIESGAVHIGTTVGEQNVEQVHILLLPLSGDVGVNGQVIIMIETVRIITFLKKLHQSLCMA